MDKKIKYTKHDKIMAFLTIEDMVGSVEVIVFPQTYEKYSYLLNEESKVLIQGRISLEEERDGKLICEKITSFDDIPRKVWLKFGTMEEYTQKNTDLEKLFADSEGNDQVIIYIESTKQKKQLPPNQNIRANAEMVETLETLLGEENVKVVC